MSVCLGLVHMHPCVRTLTDQEQVLISAHNALGNDRYYDVDSSSSFAFDHSSQVVQPDCCLSPSTPILTDTAESVLCTVLQRGFPTHGLDASFPCLQLHISSAV